MCSFNKSFHLNLLLLFCTVKSVRISAPSDSMYFVSTKCSDGFIWIIGSCSCRRQPWKHIDESSLSWNDSSIPVGYLTHTQTHTNVKKEVKNKPINIYLQINKYKLINKYHWPLSVWRYLSTVPSFTDNHKVS